MTPREQRREELIAVVQRAIEAELVREHGDIDARRLAEIAVDTYEHHQSERVKDLLNKTRRV